MDIGEYWIIYWGGQVFSRSNDSAPAPTPSPPPPPTILSVSSPSDTQKDRERETRQLADRRLGKEGEASRSIQTQESFFLKSFNTLWRAPALSGTGRNTLISEWYIYPYWHTVCTNQTVQCNLPCYTLNMQIPRPILQGKTHFFNQVWGYESWPH